MAGLPWIKVHTNLPRDPRSLHLADLLADARAWTYVLQMRLYLAEHAAGGAVSGVGAVATVERSAGWMGERGRLVDAMRDAGFVRAGPARDGGGTEVVDLDWRAEQGAHVEKFSRDAKKPRGNRVNVVSPSRDIGGTSAGPSLTPRGESRELRVESREEEPTLSTSVDPRPLEESPADLRALWNAEADPRLPRWRDLTGKRATQAGARLSERPLAQWRLILGRINASPFCLGQNDRGWKADVEFFLRPDTATKVLEGKYDAKAAGAPAAPRPSDDGWEAA